MKTIPSVYQSSDYENAIYQKWETSGLFTPVIDVKKKPFTISIPPPNATGTLHLGHAIMLALEDIMIRFHRMKGDPTLWLPGTDHAGIATQNKVEKLLAAKGKTRHDLGREAFIETVKAFVSESQTIIRNQVRKMGASVDWTRERYTFDEGLSKAVQEVFIRMHQDGIIYRGNRIVNWCPRCSSTLADDEVEYKQEQSRFYYMKYGPFIIGTARPETKFLDKVIVVHPDDERYKEYHGKKLIVPWINGDVQALILADQAADPEFGTGAMTITPGHDFIDFEIAKRHNIEIISIIDERGNLTNAAGEFAGMNAREARPLIVKKLKEKGLIEKIEDNYIHNLSVCYRCDTPIEPLVSKQWFVDVNKAFSSRKSLKRPITGIRKNQKVTLKQLMRHVVETNQIKIVPDRFQKTYFHWIDNLRDWCISRQIWFGHRIPVWYCIGDTACKLECKNPIVQLTPPTACPHCGSLKLKQDPDTLDTWFSSGLWTFSTLGWPDETADLKYFHPTSVLETGYDILFFWVARMILMTTYAVNEIPFDTVYLHGLVRTRTGEKMSKSKPETCIDPLDMIQKYGADALRLSMIAGGTPGNDIRLYEEKIAGYRNFVNKIWNATRFALLQIQDEHEAKPISKELKRTAAISLADKWILTHTQIIIQQTTDHLEKLQFSEAGTKIYDFMWSEYCAWYLEISKGEHKNIAVLLYVLKTALKLLHPFVPFVTEALWHQLDEPQLLIGESWPQFQKNLTFKKEAEEMQIIIDTISSIRSIRQESGIEAGLKLHAIIYAKKDYCALLEGKREPIARLGRLATLDIHELADGITEHHKIQNALSQYLSQGIEIYLPVGDIIDISAERKRLAKEHAQLTAYLKTLEAKLANPHFTEKAPQALVEEQKEKYAAEKSKLEKVERKLEQL